MKIIGHVVNLNWYISADDILVKRQHLFSHQKNMESKPHHIPRKSNLLSLMLKEYVETLHIFGLHISQTKNVNIQLFTEINYFILLQSRRCIDVLGVPGQVLVVRCL